MINEKALLKAIRKIKPYDSYDEYEGEDLINEVILIELSEVTNCIKQQPKVGEWIPCKDGKNMPPERESMFAKLKGTDKWHDGMFERISDDVDVTVEYDDGTRVVKTIHTVDGKWKYQGFTKPKVIAWRVKPEPYKEVESE